MINNKINIITLRLPIESGMLTRSLEGAQRKVETFYYDARKQVFEYDEVMNNQRRAIYAERRRVLEGMDLKEQVLQYAEKTMDEIILYLSIIFGMPGTDYNMSLLFFS